MYPKFENPRDAEPDGCMNLTDRVYNTQYGFYLLCESCVKSGHSSMPRYPAKFVRIGERRKKCECEHIDHIK